MDSNATERSLPETILLWFLQVLGAATAILFGTFGILSWNVADEANSLANEANQLANEANRLTDTANMFTLVTLCGGGLSGNTNVSLQKCVHGSLELQCSALEDFRSPPPFFSFYAEIRLL